MHKQDKVALDYDARPIKIWARVMSAEINIFWAKGRGNKEVRFVKVDRRLPVNRQVVLVGNAFNVNPRNILEVLGAVGSFVRDEVPGPLREMLVQQDKTPWRVFRGALGELGLPRDQGQRLLMEKLVDLSGLRESPGEQEWDLYQEFLNKLKPR